MIYIFSPGTPQCKINFMLLVSHHPVVFKHVGESVLLTSLLPRRNLTELECINPRKGSVNHKYSGGGAIGVTMAIWTGER